MGGGGGAGSETQKESPGRIGLRIVADKKQHGENHEET